MLSAFSSRAMVSSSFAQRLEFIIIKQASAPGRTTPSADAQLLQLIRRAIQQQRLVHQGDLNRLVAESKTADETEAAQTVPGSKVRDAKSDALSHSDAGSGRLPPPHRHPSTGRGGGLTAGRYDPVAVDQRPLGALMICALSVM